MTTKEKEIMELALKNILYHIEDLDEQKKMISMLEDCEKQFPDSKIKNLIEKIILKSKKGYCKKVDYLIDIILDDVSNKEQKNTIYRLLEQIKPFVEKAEKNMWDKLMNLFKWS